MPKRSYFLLACFWFAAAPEQALAQANAERPTFRVGDTWRYEFGNSRYAKPGCIYAVSVERVTKSNVYARVEFPDGCEVSMTTSYPIASGSVQKFDLSLNHFHFSNTPYRAVDFPLYVGKAWTQKWKWKLNGWTYDDEVAGSVESFEKLTTSAGVFDTYKIRLVRTYRGSKTGDHTQSGKLEDTFWYAPQVKNFVKRSYVDGKWANITRELVSFEVK